MLKSTCTLPLHTTLAQNKKNHIQQIDVNGDGTLSWEEFTGFVIDQVLAMTQETPATEALKERDLPPLDRIVQKFEVSKIRFAPGMGISGSGRLLVCVGPIVQVCCCSTCVSCSSEADCVQYM